MHNNTTTTTKEQDMPSRAFIAVACLLLGTPGLFAQTEPSTQPYIEIAVCLVTSGSMDGLIESA
jgi:hypothetical protein